MQAALGWLASTPAGNRLGEMAARSVEVVSHPRPWWTAPLEPLRWLNAVLTTAPHTFVTLALLALIALAFAARRHRRHPGWGPFLASALVMMLTLGGGTQALRALDTALPGGFEWRAPSGAPYLLANLHAHTQASGGSLMPEDVVAWHHARGFRVLAITDSNGMRGVERARAYVAEAGLPMVIVPGEEYRLKTGGTHILMLNITTPILPDERTPLDAIGDTRAQGGLAIVAHPWTSHLQLADLVSAGARGFEVTNGYVVADEPTRDLAAAGGLALTGDLDFRHGQYPMTATVLPLWADTPAKVQAALEQGECAALFFPSRVSTGRFSFREQLQQTVGALVEEHLPLLLWGLAFWACVGAVAWRRVRMPIASLAPGAALVVIVVCVIVTVGLAIQTMWWRFRTGWYPRTEWAYLTWAVATLVAWWALPAVLGNNVRGRSLQPDAN